LISWAKAARQSCSLSVRQRQRLADRSTKRARRCRCVGSSCRPGREAGPHGTERVARGRVRLRLRPVLATIPTCCRRRPCRGHRLDGARDASGASHACRPLCPRPAQQRRTAKAAGYRSHDSWSKVFRNTSDRRAAASAGRLVVRTASIGCQLTDAGRGRSANRL
jgi:hypothetical protein